MKPPIPLLLTLTCVAADLPQLPNPLPGVTQSQPVYKVPNESIKAVPPGTIEQPLTHITVMPTVPSNLLPYATFTTTNRVTNLLAVIRMSNVSGPCPECGAPNHHQQQVAMMSAQDVIYANVVAEGRTNTMRVATGPSTNWVATNLVYRPPGLWPTNFQNGIPLMQHR